MANLKNTRLKTVLTDAHDNYGKMLNAHAFFKTQDHAMSDDLVQDTFIKTWKYLVKKGKIDTMKAFLYHVLDNRIIDEYRKRKTTSLEVLAQKGFEPRNKDAGRLFDILDGKAALLLIARLPETYQKVMRMKYVQGLTPEEMSLVTGQSKNAIYVQAHRGLEKLKLLYYPINIIK